ncbi:ABC transporter permease subunit [Porcincola intestinalis]|jgi:methyl-galactoside transport system permease protein|uniref:ABC transporter permease subunit n=1 Tax=Porcincola intestinalis TaxID=2606632 RepID=UPI002A81D3E1|nr:beta-methylgalactoside transporter [Porcincola intestinalis]MDY4205179.1 beta-methylgalactoside transporter [Porcincola intestinalis]
MNTKKKKLSEVLLDNALIIALVAMIIGIIIIEPSFFQWRVVTDILTQSAVKLICALGLMFTLLLGGTDLAGGRQVGLAAVICASMCQDIAYSNRFWPNFPDLPVIVPILITLGVVACIGLVNGLMITKLHMAPFIATYGMASAVYGINQLYFAKEPNNSQPIGGIKDGLTVLSRFKIGGQISIMVVIAFVIMLVVWFVLNKTTFGRNIYIVGGNSEAAKVSGISVTKITIACFVIESILVGLGGILEVARTGGANSSYGNAYEFDAITSCVIGGVSLSGGIGKISGAFIGVMIFTFISYGLSFIGLNSNWQLVIKGVIICASVALDMRKNAKK